nr:hypothetical protein [Tanacetum cinerariifolium]
MRTRSSSNLPVESPLNPSTSNPKRRNRRRSKQPFILEESLVDTMADQRTMAELLRAPTEGYAEAIVGSPSVAQKEPPRSILTWEDLVSKFINEFFPPQEQQISQTSAVTTAPTAILKQFQATPPPASVKAVEGLCITCGGTHPYYQCLAVGGNTFPELRDNIQGYISAAAINYNQGNSVYHPSGLGSLSGNTIAIPKGELKAITTQNSIVLDGPSKLPEKLGDPGKFLIPCGFSELKCKALADLANQTICTPAGIARDVFILVGKFTFLADFVIVDYESDHRVPLILVRPFLRTVCALFDVHREEMILRDGDERLTLNMRHDTSSYSNQPQKESSNMINIFNDSREDFLENLFATNHQSGNLTFSSHPEFTSPKVKYDVFDPKEAITTSSLNHLLEEFADELALDMDSILKDSIDQNKLADLNDNLANTMPEMFINEHALDYSSPSLYDEYDDDLFEVESNTKNVYDDPFDSKGEKIKDSKLLIDQLDLPSDFLPFSDYDSFLFEDFSNVDDLPSTKNEDK